MRKILIAVVLFTLLVISSSISAPSTAADDDGWMMYQLTNGTIDVTFLAITIKGSVPPKTRGIYREIIYHLFQEGFWIIENRTCVPLALVVLNPWERYKDLPVGKIIVGLLDPNGTTWNRFFIDLSHEDYMELIMTSIALWELANNQANSIHHKDKERAKQ